MPDITNALSIDVEDYFQVSAFENYIPRENWDSLPTNIERNTERILEFLDEYNTHATFFVLGWVAERFPGIIQKISDAGHEVASHGYSHVRVTNQTQGEFYEDISKTKKILEDIISNPVIGYRAASYSITKTNTWAHSEIEKAGYKYSSSVYPIKHDLYGIPDAPRYLYKPNGNEFLEIPISTFQFLGYRFPCGGGGFFRLYPYCISRSMIAYVNHHENKPCMFYFHPWEIDTDQPVQNNLGFKARFRHYLNIDKMETRLKRLLQDFKWGKIQDVYLR